MEKIINIILIVLILAVLLISIKIGIEKNEKRECYQWKNQAIEYPLFHLTQDQKAQCDFWHIEIDTKVI